MAEKALLVDDDMVNAFQRDGVVCLRQVFSSTEIDHITRGIQQARSHPSDHGEALKSESGGEFFNDYCNWRHIPEFDHFIRRSHCAEIVALLMRSRQAVFYHEHVLCKDKNTSKATPWHQDQPYYPIDGQQLCSVWIPVDPVPLESSLKFVRGSHRDGPRFIPRKFATTLDYTASQRDIAPRWMTVPDVDAMAEKGEADIISFAVEPGDCIVFHGCTLHAAEGNLSSTTERRVLSLRWAGDDAVFAARPWEISPPINGGLKVGDRLACDMFPIIYERPLAASVAL